MRKRYNIALAVLLVAILVMIAWPLLLRLGEPVYQGKRLSYWFRAYARQTRQMSEATNAFAQLGERAVPYLARVLEGPDPWWQKPYNLAAQRLPKSLAGGLTTLHVEARFAALDALALLAPSAPGAVPAIINALNAPDVVLQRSVPSILGRLRPITSNVVAALVYALTRNGDWYTQEEALQALGGMGPAATNAIPALADALKHEHPDFREWAAEGLGNMGLSAQAAVPGLLLTATHDQLLWVREAASNALLKIDPEAAAKAGVK